MAQRWYAFTVLSLRDVFRATGAEHITAGLARIVLTLAGALSVFVAVVGLSLLTGHVFEGLRSTAFVLCTVVVLRGLYVVNRKAERHVLPTFEPRYQILSKRRRITYTAAIMVGIAALMLTMIILALAGRTLYHN